MLKCKRFILSNAKCCDICNGNAAGFDKLNFTKVGGNLKAQRPFDNIASLLEEQDKMTNHKHRFDFDIGYLIKSPCKNCEMQQSFPKCSEDCQILDKIQEMLCGAVSSTRGYSSLESFAISMESWGRK